MPRGMTLSGYPLAFGVRCHFLQHLDQQRLPIALIIVGQDHLPPRDASHLPQSLLQADAIRVFQPVGLVTTVSKTEASGGWRKRSSTSVRRLSNFGPR